MISIRSIESIIVVKKADAYQCVCFFDVRIIVHVKAQNYNNRRSRDESESKYGESAIEDIFRKKVVQRRTTICRDYSMKYLISIMMVN